MTFNQHAIVVLPKAHSTLRAGPRSDCAYAPDPMLIPTLGPGRSMGVQLVDMHTYEVVRRHGDYCVYTPMNIFVLSHMEARAGKREQRVCEGLPGGKLRK